MKTQSGIYGAGLGTGKKARLNRILHQHGMRNGTAIFLPYDHGLEHGPRDFFANLAVSDPAYIIRLALEGGFNGIALQIGLAEKFYWDFAGEVPLVLKLNGKTDIPSDAEGMDVPAARIRRAGSPRSPARWPIAWVSRWSAATASARNWRASRPSSLRPPATAKACTRPSGPT